MLGEIGEGYKEKRNTLIYQFSLYQLLQAKTDRIFEMASVMHRSIEIDNQFQATEQKLKSRLITENEVIMLGGLRGLVLEDPKSRMGPSPAWLEHFNSSYVNSYNIE